MNYDRIPDKQNSVEYSVHSLTWKYWTDFFFAVCSIPLNGKYPSESDLPTQYRWEFDPAVSHPCLVRCSSFPAVAPWRRVKSSRYVASPYHVLAWKVCAWDNRGFNLHRFLFDGYNRDITANPGICARQSVWVFCICIVEGAPSTIVRQMYGTNFWTRL